MSSESSRCRCGCGCNQMYTSPDREWCRDCEAGDCQPAEQVRIREERDTSLCDHYLLVRRGGTCTACGTYYVPTVLTIR